jgi:hypothetical protein
MSVSNQLPNKSPPKKTIKSIKGITPISKFYKNNQATVQA